MPGARQVPGAGPGPERGVGALADIAGRLFGAVPGADPAASRVRLADALARRGRA